SNSASSNSASSNSASSNSASSNNAGNEKKSYVDWGRHWFAQLARHHRVHDPAKWSFSEQDVIAFLRAKVKSGGACLEKSVDREGLDRLSEPVPEVEVSTAGAQP
ncbi:MAG: hypothetical protein WBF93_03560, partial [Pirellulales bacterium]